MNIRWAIRDILANRFLHSGVWHFTDTTHNVWDAYLYETRKRAEKRLAYLNGVHGDSFEIVGARAEVIITDGL